MYRFDDGKGKDRGDEEEEEDEECPRLTETSSFECTFPSTKLLWSPNETGLLATAGDHLRLWNVNLDENDTTKKKKKKKKKDEDRLETDKTDSSTCKQKSCLKNETFAPLTSIDWNRTDPTMMGALNYDKDYFSCTLWDIETETPEVNILLDEAKGSTGYDLAFHAKDGDIFGTVGEDGKLRIFDVRSLKRVSIVHETDRSLFRLIWNPQNPLYVGVLFSESSDVMVLDLRSSREPVLSLSGHTAQVNAIAWAPQSANHMCTVSDDKQANVWDFSRQTAVTEPMLSYGTDSKINNVAWSAAQNSHIALAAGKRLQILRV